MGCSTSHDAPNGMLPGDDWRLASVEPRTSPNEFMAISGQASMDDDKRMDTKDSYEVPADALAEAWVQVVSEQPETQIVEQKTLDGGTIHVVAVQRSPCCQFPDVISAEIMAVDEHRATLAVLSRSILGYSDWGANEKRLRAWIAQLHERISS